MTPDLLTFAIFCLIQSPKLTFRGTNGHGAIGKIEGMAFIRMSLLAEAESS